jgi:hypothetical protein
MCVPPAKLLESTLQPFLIHAGETPALPAVFYAMDKLASDVRSMCSPFEKSFLLPHSVVFVSSTGVDVSSTYRGNGGSIKQEKS